MALQKTSDLMALPFSNSIILNSFLFILCAYQGLNQDNIYNSIRQVNMFLCRFILSAIVKFFPNDQCLLQMRLVVVGLESGRKKSRKSRTMLNYDTLNMAIIRW